MYGSLSHCRLASLWRWIAGAVSIVLAIPTAYAQQPLPWIYCGRLPGCSPNFGAAVTTAITNAITYVSTKLSTGALPFGALFVMVGGVFMLFGGMNEEYLTKGKNTITWALIGVVVVRFATLIVQVIVAAGTDVQQQDQNVIMSALKVATAGITDLVQITLYAVALYYGMRMVTSRGKEEEFSKARNGLIYAMVGAILVTLATVLVSAIQQI